MPAQKIANPDAYGKETILMKQKKKKYANNTEMKCFDTI